MFFDGKNTTEPTNLTYDLVIIGAGPAGITVAHELQETGLRIALLESGGKEFDPDTQELYDTLHSGNQDTDMLAGRLRFLGGTSNHWGGHCLPLDRIDFERQPRNGMSGWPVTYDDMLAYYPKAHEYCDLGKFDYAYESFNQITPNDLFLSDDPNIETVAFRQSPPTRFGTKYEGWLEAQTNIDVWLHTNVVDILSNAEGTIEQVATQSLSGVARTFQATHFVLACGAVENARLLLYTNTRNGRSFGNRSGLLGRCYLDHPSGGAAFVHFDKRVPDKVYWRGRDFLQDGVPVRFLMRLSEDKMRTEELNNLQFIVAPFPDTEEDLQRKREAGKSLSGLRSIGKWALNYDPDPRFSLSNSFCNFITNADSFATEAFINATQDRSGYKRILLKFEAEQTPDPINGIRLIEEKDALGMPKIELHWEVSDDDIASIQRTTEIFGQSFGAAGLGRMQMEDHSDRPYWGTTTAWHQLGTTRMAQSENDGVVNPDCQVWGTNNLYIASGGVMPTSGRANPTLTIVALSIRLSDHLRQKVLQ